MSAVRAEFLKLKRSMSWAVVVILPLVLTVTAVVNTLADGNPLPDGWHTLWMRAVVFYGLFPLAVGIGILGSLVWRSEHRGSNWNALMSGPTPSLSVVAAKAAAVALLAASMQVVMLVAVVLVGKLAFGLPGLVPAVYVLLSMLIALAVVPVAALQSGLSMVMRSFAAPIAVAFLGAGVSAVLLTAGLDWVLFVSPYALVTRATQLGTATFADTGTIGADTVISIVVGAVLLTTLIVAGTARILERSDTRT